MRFVSWQSHRMVGPGLVEPAWLAWDPDASFAALGYPDAVVLYRLQPQFTAFASLPLKVQSCLLCLSLYYESILYVPHFRWECTTG